MNQLVKSIGAGIAISIGAAIYLSCTDKIVGAIMFTVGLFTICVFQLNLFTGKIGYFLEQKNKLDFLVVWGGNLIGCLIASTLLRLANPSLTDIAQVLVQNKLGLDLHQTIILGAFCGILMFIAVHCFRTRTDVGRYIGLFICVPVFILCGFEHSIANMCYFTLGVTSFDQAMWGFVFILIVSVSNGLGSVIFRVLTKEKE